MIKIRYRGEMAVFNPGLQSWICSDSDKQVMLNETLPEIGPELGYISNSCLKHLLASPLKDEVEVLETDPVSKTKPEPGVVY